MASRDGCVVDSAPLAGIVREFIDRWRAVRSSACNQFAPNHQRATSDTVSAIEWLSCESGVSPDAIKSLTRRSSPRNATTELWIADALVSAIGHPEAFHDGTLVVKPNPRAARDARACCGGAFATT